MVRPDLSDDGFGTVVQARTDGRPSVARRRHPRRLRSALVLFALSSLTDACSTNDPSSDPGANSYDVEAPIGNGAPIPLDPALSPGNPPPPDGPAIWVGSGRFDLVYDTAAQNPSRYINDHTLVKANDGTWHMFGITSGPQGEVQFAHATAANVRGPWKREADVLHVDPNYFREVHVWAPHVIEHRGTYYMFYAGGERDGNGANAAISVATSKDLFTWTRRPEGPLFRDGLEARDAFVTRIGTQWVMYYTGSTLPNQGKYAVLYRTSDDLIRWSERRIAYTDGATTTSGPCATESPFVVERDGSFYLFLGPRGGYVGTDVFRSSDPFHFEVANYAGHFPSHAAEVVRDGDQWLVTSAGTFQRGLYIAELHWRTSPPIWQSRQNPTVVRDSTGRLNVFAVSADRSLLLQRRQLEPGGDFGDWTTFGDRTGTAPIAVPNQNGLLNVFAIDPNGQAVVRRSETSPGTWDAWRPFDGPAGALPMLAPSGDGHLEAFSLAPAGASIRRASQSSPNGSFSNDPAEWETFGTAANGPPVLSSSADGRIEVFALGPDASYVAHRWQNAPNESWSPWQNFAGPVAMPPSVGRHADGRLMVLAVSPVGFGLHARSQVTPSGAWGNWTDFQAFGGDAPVMISNPDGRIEIFVLAGGGSHIQHRWQNAPNGSFSAWEDFGGGPAMCSPSVAREADGRIVVFAAAPDGTIRRRTQLAPNSSWGSWLPFSGPVAVWPCGSPT